ncbi:MAG: choice-of-anchor D domain-containing protein [Thiothrix sp.]|nr:MAG: choice-of-anchor D domain-containing protein [Thiothrix sp.]
MPCTNITNGFFIPSLWTDGTITVNTPNGTTITSVTNGNYPGCFISKNNSSLSFPQPPTGSVKFLVFGSPANFIAVLTIGSGANNLPKTRSVVVVDVSGSIIRSELISTTSELDSVSLPLISPCQGDGSVFLLTAAQNGSLRAAIHLSANGATLCFTGPFVPNQQILGNATASRLQILEGASEQASCPRPQGKAKVNPSLVSFPHAVIGSGVDPALSNLTKSVVITNQGTDCLRINSIGSISPFTVSQTNPPLPATIEPSQTITIVISFSPNALGTFNANLPITATVNTGDQFINCHGVARTPRLVIEFDPSISFGNVPVSTSAQKNLVIRNRGERAVNILLPALSMGSFSWPAFNGVIQPAAASPAIPITFRPQVEGNETANLAFTSDIPSSPHQIRLSGEGCVARAQLVIDQTLGSLINFRTIQRGFRGVRLVRIKNIGNGTLSFRARVEGNSLFGLQRINGAITNPLSEDVFSISPTQTCGAGLSGTGELLFAVTFFANATVGLQQGQLIIDNHNDAFGAPVELRLNLTAEVIAEINVDVELVIDRSGSMAGSSGERRNIDTALAAAQLFVQLGRADIDDRLGLVRFNTQPEQVQTLSSLTGGSQTGLLNTLNEANFSPAGGTAIAGGILQALKDMRGNPRGMPPAQLNQAMVVLTDANDNTPYNNPDDGISYTLLGEGSSTPVNVPPEIRLYGIGIGDAVDTGRLAQLCPTTGGQFLHVQTFSGLDFFKLEKHFTQIYMATVDMAQILDPSFVIAAYETHEHPFTVLRGDVTFMVVIYDRDQVRLPFWLQSPQGEIVDLSSIPEGFQLRVGLTRTARFIELRLPAKEPERYAGQWILTVKHEGQWCFMEADPQSAPWLDHKRQVTQQTPQARQDALSFGFSSNKCKPIKDAILYGFVLGVGSNFRMAPFMDPAPVRVGQALRLNAVVTEFSLPVLGCEVSVDITAPDGSRFSIHLKDDGQNSDGLKDDGDYGGVFTHTYQEGMYSLIFRAQGISRDHEPVLREASLSKYIVGRFKLVPSKEEYCASLFPKGKYEC